MLGVFITLIECFCVFNLNHFLAILDFLISIESWFHWYYLEAKINNNTLNTWDRIDGLMINVIFGIHESFQSSKIPLNATPIMGQQFLFNNFSRLINKFRLHGMSTFGMKGYRRI